jgi:F0F1-type ATP synthase membrane subunit b/b'
MNEQVLAILSAVEESGGTALTSFIGGFLICWQICQHTVIKRADQRCQDLKEYLDIARDELKEAKEALAKAREDHKQIFDEYKREMTEQEKRCDEKISRISERLREVEDSRFRTVRDEIQRD